VTVSTYLLVAWIALLGADRIDLLGGDGLFLLTPFLILTPVYLTYETIRVAVFRERLTAWKNAPVYSLLLLVFLSVVVLSTFGSTDILASARRSLLLVALSLGTLSVALLATGRAQLERALVLGAEAGLAIAVLFGAFQIAVVVTLIPDEFRVGYLSVDLMPMRYAGLFPRLSGQVVDANRAGLLFLFYLFVLGKWADPGPRRRAWMAIGIVLLLLTLSRSALLAAACVAAVAAWSAWKGRLSPGVMLTTTICVALVTALLLASPNLRGQVGRALEPLGARFSLSEGSAQDHRSLLERGIEEATVSVRRAAVGAGYGESFLLLQDIFPGNRYGNFHSLFLTVMVESGVFALILCLVLLGVPLIYDSPLRPMVAGLVGFNLFYQSLSEPTFWFVLALAWLSLRYSGPAGADAKSGNLPTAPLIRPMEPVAR